MRLKYRIWGWMRDRIPHFYVKKFDRLEDMDQWENSIWFRILGWLGLIQPSYFSPIWESCLITPYNVDPEYIAKNHPGDLPGMVEKLMENYGEYCECDNKTTKGKLIGIESTQEDYYWVLEDAGKQVCCTACCRLWVINKIRSDITRYHFI